MTSDDDLCLACREAEGTCYDSEAGHFRLWCLFFSHTTQRDPDLDLVRLEWRGIREGLDG